MRHRTLLPAVLVSTMFTMSAQAQSPGPAAPAQPAVAPAWPENPSTEVERYGWQIVLADLAGATAAIAATNATGAGGFLLAFPVAAPTVHALHGNGSAALMSLGLHVAAPLAGAYVGYQIDSANCGPDEWFCGIGGAGLGVLVGAVAATITDATVLAKKERPIERGRSRMAVPTVAVAPGGGFMLGLTGAL